MTTTTGAPRPDHIANLTMGVQLPLEPIQDVIMSVILETVSNAWQQLCNEGAPALHSGTEPEVSALLGPRLNNLRESNALWSSLVSAVGMGSEAFNFSGTRLQTKPDFHLVLTRRNANFPLIVECKLIDHPKGKTIGLYCANGIERFVCGDYAWANREAIMLAYVRDGSTPPSRLVPHLANSAKTLPDPLMTASHPRSKINIHPTVHHTEHQRNFSYPFAADGNEPGPIGLFHLWL